MSPARGQNAGMTIPHDAHDSVDYVPFEEFRSGLPHGRFRVVVNPSLASPFVAQRTHATPLAIAVIGAGIAAALTGYPWIGGILVATGILLRRVVKAQAPRILLHLAAHLPTVYEQATTQGVMEVRRA